MSKFAASPDGETFIRDCIAATPEAAVALAVAAFGLKAGDEVYVGEVKDYGMGERFYPGADALIDAMNKAVRDYAFDLVGKAQSENLNNNAAYQREWIGAVSIPAQTDLEVAVGRAIQGWIEVQGLRPEFFGVENIERHKVAVRQ